MKTDPASRPRLNRAETKEQTRRLLLEAAQRIFLQFGYQGATLDRIADDAGFTKGAVYWHFESKEALFLELVVDAMRRNSRDLDQLITNLESAPERLDEVLGQWLDGVDTRDSLPLLVVELELESLRKPSFAVMLNDALVRHEAVIARMIERIFEISGRTPPMPTEDLSASIIRMVEGFALAGHTRQTSPLTSAKAIKVLLGMPASS